MALKKIILVAALAASTASPAIAGEWSGSATVANNYALKFATLTNDPVANISVTRTVGEDCFMNIWGQVGVESAGDEVDFTAGCSVKGFGTVKVQTFHFENFGNLELKPDVINTQWSNKFGDLTVLAQYMTALDGTDGYLATIAHPIGEVEGVKFGLAAHAGSAPFSGKEFLSLDANARYAITDNVALGGLFRSTTGGPIPGETLQVSLSYSF